MHSSCSLLPPPSACKCVFLPPLLLAPRKGQVECVLVRSCVCGCVAVYRTAVTLHKSTCTQSCWCCDVNALTVLGLYTPVRKPLSQRFSSSQVLGTVRRFKKSCCAMWTDLVRSERHTFPSLLEVLHGRNRVKFSHSCRKPVSSQPTIRNLAPGRFL